jgi:predicted nucleic acid-binding protein
LIEEPGSDEVAAAATEAHQLASGQLAYVEVHSALARMKASRRLSERQRVGRVNAFHSLWSGLAVVPASETTVIGAAALAERHLLRGFDAVHLASTLELRDAGTVGFASYDDQLNHAAKGEDIPLHTPRGDEK